MNPLRSWKAAGLVAALFATLIAAALIANRFHAVAADPLQDNDLAAMKAELATRPRDTALKERIRLRDAEIRGEYAGRAELARKGALLLIVSAVLAVGMLKLTRRLAEQPFDPRGRPAPDPLREAVGSRWGIAAGGLALLGGLAAIGIGTLPTQAPANSIPLLPPTAAEIARNWPGFRGPAAGVAACPAPTTWDATAGTNLRWKLAIPLPGVGSPAVWDSTVYLTGSDGMKQEVYAIDTASGALRWTRAVAVPPGAAGDIFSETGFAAPSPATDGNRVVALFASGALTAIAADGTPLWTQQLGRPESQYGLASSPLIWRDLVIIQLDQGSAEDGKSALIAIDLANGRERWRIKRDLPASWASPIVATLGGREMVITCGQPRVTAYAPADGRELWRLDCLANDVASSPAVSGGLVLVGNANAKLSAIRPDGSLVWSRDSDLPDTTSLVGDGGLAAMLTSSSSAVCFDAASGTPLWEHPFSGATFISSPVLAGGNLYLTDSTGLTTVVAWERSFSAIGTGHVGEKVSATPAIVGGRIYLRGAKHLFCIGAPP